MPIIKFQLCVCVFMSSSSRFSLLAPDPHFLRSPDTNRYSFVILWPGFIRCAPFFRLSAFLWNNLDVIREIEIHGFNVRKGNSPFNGHNLRLHFNVLFTSFWKYNWLCTFMAAQYLSYSPHFFFKLNALHIHGIP